MVEEQLRARGISDVRVLEAMLTTPREIFVPPDARDAAYEDRALPIGRGQTISQPFIVGYMAERLVLNEHCRVLEIGTGSGYQTAILAPLCKWVYSVERLDALHVEAARILKELDIRNVTLSTGDGTLGLADEAPFDRIIVSAAAPQVPPTLVSQLADGGRLVIPVGGPVDQTITVVERVAPRTIESPMLGCRFVKLIGREGWSPEDA